MNTTDLELYCNLIETRSFTRAAERHFISQPAVSQRIRAMERHFGQILVDRGKGKGRVVPTDAGKVLYDGAKALIGQTSELEMRIRGISDEISGTVRVATVYSVGLHALPGRLKPFLAAHPNVNVHLEYSRTGKVYQDVLSGVVDVGIVACPQARAGIEIVPFGEERMALICAPEHRLANAVSVQLSELEEEPFIAFADDIPTRKLTDERLRAAGVRVRIVMSFDNIETIKNLVEIGSGVALVPENTVRSEVREGALTVVPLAIDDEFLRPAGILIKPSAMRRASISAFVEAMKERS
jgi:DNA-binding transcriptional LysR family regulator